MRSEYRCWAANSWIARSRSNFEVDQSFVHNLRRRWAERDGTSQPLQSSLLKAPEFRNYAMRRNRDASKSSY